jgi:molybdopterin biosynthesis enzyme
MKNNDCSSSISESLLDSLKQHPGKTFVVGACAGVLTSVLGVSVACLVGFKALFGSAVATTVVTGAGAIGGVTNVSLKNGRKTAKKKRTEREKESLF